MSDPNPYAPSPGLESSGGSTAVSTVEIELVEKDYIAYNLFFHKADGQSRRMVIRLAVVGAIGALSLGYLVGGEGSGLLDFLLPAAAFLLVLPFVPWLMKRSIRRSVKLMLKGTSGRALFGRRTLSISGESIVSKNEHQYSELKWLIIDRLEITPDYLYIMPTGVSAHIVPREAFQSDGEFKGFCDLASQYFQASREDS